MSTAVLGKISIQHTGELARFEALCSANGPLTLFDVRETIG